MDYWPSYIAGPSSISGGVDDPYIEAQADTSDDAARSRFSAARLTSFKLSWNAMMVAELWISAYQNNTSGMRSLIAQGG